MTHAPNHHVGPSRNRWVVDTLIALTVAAVLCVQVTVATEPAAKSFDGLALALAAGVGVALLWRRTQPAAVLFVSVVFVLAYHVLEYPAIGMAWPLGVALGNAAHAGRARTAVVTIGVLLSGAVVWRVLLEPEPPLQVFTSSVQEMSMAATVILAGYTLRSRRQLADETRERMRLDAVQQQRTVERQMVEERIRVARELHDVVAHTVALIGIHARVGSEAIDDDLPRARQALEVIDQATRRARSELGATIDLLRDERAAPLAPTPGLEHLPAMIASVVAGGLAVELEIEGNPRPVPGSVELAAYRIVQEALTNVVRHADASRACVNIGYQPSSITVAISDDGGGAVAASGHGITGMRERVHAAGGRLSITGEGGGLRVLAELPTSS